MLHPTVKVEKNENYAQARDRLLQSERETNENYLLNVIETGRVSNMAYGAHVRSVQMTRGNRQGNNAFLEYQDNTNTKDEFFGYNG